ncbi:MAG: competence/damage-inducible protein A [Firmicutes bacterium]|nr:competence/damage-inducible protein A [Bacillota bacterium]
MIAEILNIGTELLLGHVVDTNSAYIGRKLAGIGINLYHKTTVGDNEARAIAALHDALNRADIVIITGGLGPTEDDITREVVSRVFGIRQVHSDEAMAHAVSLLNRWGHEDQASLRRLAQIPEGAILIPNPRGTACGFIVEKPGKQVICLPGVPGEMQAMMELTVIPYLTGLEGEGKIIASRTIKICGPGEAEVEDRIRHLLHGKSNPTIAPLVSLGEVMLRITAKAHSMEEACSMIDQTEVKLRESLGHDIYGTCDDEIQHAVVRLLEEKQMRCAVAESVTGGLIAHKLTEVPGCSKVLGLAVTSYSNDAKIKVLGVPEADIERYGAVSREVALQMARGIRSLSGADVSISTTGVAGPLRDDHMHNVGLVFIGLAWNDGIACGRFQFFGTRSEIKERIAKKSLDILRRHLLRHHLVGTYDEIGTI